jgi:periplasmic divalent cation tolerance protein
MKNGYSVLYTTFPNLRSAKSIISGMVRAKIIACGNIFRIFSIYRWHGKIEKNPEYGALMKTKHNKYLAAKKYLKENHPYDVPEIISWHIDQGEKDYLDWIRRVTR